MKIFIDRISNFLSVQVLKEQARELSRKVGYVVSCRLQAAKR
ncbi:hypothetical protein [Colwellia sp. C1TZA3]|nr:hypothetical protein [Colwellia sp. C1TZA3]